MIVDLDKIYKKEKKLVLIGEINFSEDNISLDESSQIESGSSKKLQLSGISTCNVYVNNVEGPIPHVHAESKDKSFGCCVCLHDALYFPHGNDPLTKGVFNSKQRKEFDKWMNKTNVSGDPSLTNFEYAAFLWYKFFNEKYGEMYRRNGITYNIKPDYVNMKGDVNPNLR